jgi:hypothetical protein
MDALAALPHRFIRQADDEELRQPARDLDLHFHSARFEPQKSNRGDMRDHRRAPSPLKPPLWTERLWKSIARGIGV